MNVLNNLIKLTGITYIAFWLLRGGEARYYISTGKFFEPYQIGIVYSQIVFFLSFMCGLIKLGDK